MGSEDDWQRGMPWRRAKHERSASRSGLGSEAGSHVPPFKRDDEKWEEALEECLGSFHHGPSPVESADCADDRKQKPKHFLRVCRLGLHVSALGDSPGSGSQLTNTGPSRAAGDVMWNCAPPP